MQSESTEQTSTKTQNSTNQSRFSRLLSWVKNNKTLVTGILAGIVGLVGGNVDRAQSIVSSVYDSFQNTGHTNLVKRVEQLETTVNQIVDIINASDDENNPETKVDNAKTNAEIDNLLESMTGKNESSKCTPDLEPKINHVPKSPVSDLGVTVPEPPTDSNETPKIKIKN